MTEDSKSKNTIKSTMSNPVTGGIGVAIGILGILISLFTFYIGNRSRQLTYYVHPVRAVIVKGNQASRLTVLYDNNPINGDITSAQIAFWNAGKEPIKSDNILNPLVIQTGNHAPILEVRLRKETRDVTGISLDVSKVSDGKLTIMWDILEKDDGGIIEIIYAGNSEVIISANAIIEGQKDIFQVRNHGGIINTSNASSSGKLFINMQVDLLTAINIALFFLAPIFLLVNSYYRKRRMQRLEIIYSIVLIIMIFLLIYNSFIQEGLPFAF